MLSDERRSQVEHQLLLSIIRKKTSLRDLRNINRDVGTLLSEEAMMTAISTTKEELQEVMVSCVQEIIEKDLPRS
jgi:spore germination protein GerM